MGDFFSNARAKAENDSHLAIWKVCLTQKYLGLKRNCWKWKYQKEGDRKISTVQNKKILPIDMPLLLSRTILIIEHKMLKWELSQFRGILECLSQLGAVLGADSIILQVFFCCWKCKSLRIDCFLRISQKFYRKHIQNLGKMNNFALKCLSYLHQYRQSLILKSCISAKDAKT